MFCSECGAKNKKDSVFCEECGTKIEVEDEKEEVVLKKTTKKSPVDQKQANKKKLIIAIVCVVVILGIIGFNKLKTMASPKGIVCDYIGAYADKNYGKIYKYVEIDGDDTFASKDKFVSTMKESMKNTDITNYSITDVVIADSKLTATATVKYTLKDSTTEKTMYVKLVKESGNKWLFFDNWKINDADTATIKDYSIKVLKGSTIKLEGTKVTSKYLNKKDSNDTYDVYKIPVIFDTDYKINVKLPSGITLDEKINPSSYLKSSTITPTEDNLGSNSKKEIISSAKPIITAMYKGAIEKTSFADLKLEKSFESFYIDFSDDVATSSTTLKSFTLDDLTLYDFSMDSKGKVSVTFTMKYKYTITYKSWLSDKEETKENESDSGRVKAIYEYKDGKFNISEISYLPTYFSRY